MEIIKKQNELLSDNYNKLKEMFDNQIDANKEAKEVRRKNENKNSTIINRKRN